MHKLYDLKEKLCKELESYHDKELNSTTLASIDTLAHAVKNIDKIIECIEGGGSFAGSYGWNGSYGNGSYGNGSYARNGSYGMGGSYKRDSMGRYSRGGGYSRGGDVVMELTELMEEAPDERTRMEIQKCIQKMQMM